ncbi:hypothetical protein [uncultured Campylobacter sp.]|uniref:hypothetical protein n=1 Tax=uncultured Campylobacter sp. TaxID=218934 RepID=UPI002607DD1C|nr:hypothetical protein [uncultured Campylobacter sp.]
MKFLFLLYACAEKFRAAKIGAINVSLSPKASMAEFHAAKREDAMKILEFLRKQTERELEILKFLSARHFGSHKQAAEFLKFTPKLPRNRSKILKFTPKLRNGLEILKFTRASAPFVDTAQNFISQREFKILKLICSLPFALRHTLPRADKAEAGRAARLTSQHTYDAVEKRRAVKINQYLDSARRRIALRSAAARHGYKTARAENFSKFDLTGALLNFKSNFTMQLCSAVTRCNYEAWRSEIYAVYLHKYLAFIRAASGKISRYEVGQATNALLLRGVQRMKFYVLNRHAMKFLKFLGARCFGLQAAVGRGFEILKFSAAERLKYCFKPQKQAAELLNSSSLSPCRFKLALLKFTPEPPRNRSEILNFMFASYKLKLALRKFTLEVRKFKPASAVRLNFSLNSVLHARAAKFENGVKFKGAAKFKRSAR